MVDVPSLRFRKMFLMSSLVPGGGFRPVGKLTRDAIQAQPHSSLHGLVFDQKKHSATSFGSKERGRLADLILFDLLSLNFTSSSLLAIHSAFV